MKNLWTTKPKREQHFSHRWLLSVARSCQTTLLLYSTTRLRIYVGTVVREWTDGRRMFRMPEQTRREGRVYADSFSTASGIEESFTIYLGKLNDTDDLRKIEDCATWWEEASFLSFHNKAKKRIIHNEELSETMEKLMDLLRSSSGTLYSVSWLGAIHLLHHNFLANFRPPPLSTIIAP